MQTTAIDFNIYAHPWPQQRIDFTTHLTSLGGVGGVKEIVPLYELKSARSFLIGRILLTTQ